MRDQKSDVDFKTSIAAQVINATASGTGVDLRGYEAATVHINVGTKTDGTQTPKLQESVDDVDGDYSDVAAADLVGSFAALASNTNQRVGYIGSKRWVRVVMTCVGGATGCAVAVNIVRGYPAQRPLA